MMVGDIQEPEPPARASLLGQERLGAPPDREHDTAFAEFYQQYMSSLVRFLRWQGVPLAEAAEVAQDTMAQLYRSWPSVRHKLAWVRTVASRCWGRRIAEVHRVQPTDHHDLDDLASSGARRLISPDQIRAFEQRHDVLRVLDTLPPRQRQVFAWTYEGYTPTEIAEELRLDPAAVRSNLYKARLALADCLRKEQR